MKKSDNTTSVKIEKLLIKNGRVLDPAAGLDQIVDILLINGKIKKIGKFEINEFNGKIIECKDKLVVPGLIDIHVHLREPGREDEETIESGCLAAMSGGFTSVCCMPNTDPPIDSRGQVEFIKERSKGFLVNVHPIAAITKGQKGKELTEMSDMVNAGAVGFSDDGYPVTSSAVLRRALEYASMVGCPIIDHCEDINLSEDGVMNEGYVSTVLGLKGIPSMSEDVFIARDLLVAEFTGFPIHIVHVSTKDSVRMIREAKERGVKVSSETCPQYLILTDEAVRSFDTNTKMKPPLRTLEDQKALLEAIKDGTIDVIASDHAPHAIEEKETEYNAAAFGIIGLETFLGLILTYIVGKGVLTIDELVEKMSIIPRRILNLPENQIKEEKTADITIIDPLLKWRVDKTKFRSKSKNTPFDGWELEGGCFAVINNGRMFLHEDI